MVYHGTPWYTMVYHCTTTMCYNVVIYHGIPCLHPGIAWYTMFSGDLHTHTAVACLLLHQLGYLVIN